MAVSSAMSTDNQYIKYTIEVIQNSQNIANNTSNVTVKVRVYRTNTGYTTYGSGTLYCVINGTTYSESITTDDKITNSGIVLFSKTLNISHNSDGTKTLTCKAKIEHNRVTSDYQSYSQTLTTIPRTSSFGTVSGSTIGSSMTVNISRNSSSFTHNIYYRIGTGSWYTGATGVETSGTFTLNMALCNNLPNATSGTLQLLLRTYNGSTQIGSDVYKEVTVSVPSSVVPTAPTISVSEAVSGIASQFGAYVKGISKLSVSLSSSGSYSSTIKSYSTTINGVTYNGSSFTSNVLNVSGTLTITTKVTDSRGRTNSTEKEIKVCDYFTPIIDEFSVRRCDSDGTLNDEGLYAKFTISLYIASIENKNTKSCKIKYYGEQTIEVATIPLSDYELLDYTYITNMTFDIDSSHDFTLEVNDYFVQVTKGTILYSTPSLINFHENGKAIGIGHVAEREDTVDIRMQLVSRGNEYGNEPSQYSDKPTGSLLVGNPFGAHLAFGSQEIMAKEQGYFDRTLYLQRQGGTVAVGEDQDSNSKLMINGNEVATSTTQSDRRLKNTIKPIDDSLEKLFHSLNPITYYFNDDKNNEMRIGLIAQEVLKSLEDVGLSLDDVYLIDHKKWTDKKTHEEKDEYRLAYNEFISLNTYMIKKAFNKIEEQEKEINNLKELVNRLIKGETK